MHQTPEGQCASIEERLAKLEATAAAICERNSKVSADKAWEVSYARRFIIAFITYIFASILLCALGNNAFLLNALVPTAGYLLSTLTLPWAKQAWLRRDR